MIGLPYFAAAQGFIEKVYKFRQIRILGSGAGFLEEGKKDPARGTHLLAIKMISTAITNGAGAEAFKLRGQVLRSASWVCILLPYCYVISASC
jgi:hypothetical protein